MRIKLNSWIEHPLFGTGQVLEERGEKLRVRFVNAGEKTLINSAPMWPVAAPRAINFAGTSRRRAKAKTDSKGQNSAEEQNVLARAGKS